MSDLSDAAQATEDAIVALNTRIAALEQAPAAPVDLTALEARVTALEAFDADMNVITLDQFFAAMQTALMSVTAIKVDDAAETP